MDRTAFYAAVITIGLVIILSGLVIFARRLIRSPEKRATEPKLSPNQTALYLAGAIVILFLLIAIPPVGGALILAVFLWGIIDFVKMPVEKKALLSQKLAEHNKKPLVKLLNSISMALILVVIIYAVWDKLN